jgi:succinylglutamic semialdehyde dehydrogenase
MTRDRLTNFSPATGQPTWQGLAADAEAVDAAYQAARTALSGWAALTIEERSAILDAYQQQLTAEKERVAAVISAETGKPLWESKAEVDAMIGKVAISKEAYQVRCAERHKPPGITRHKPHGVVAVLGPFNFPGHLPNGHIVPALLAGNTVLFKPSEHTPVIAQLMEQLWRQAGLPAGVLSVLYGGGEVGQSVAQHPGLNGLFFTGSAKTGQALLALFSQHPEKILALEMGGNNPLVIGSAIADLQAAAYLMVQSTFLTAGQRCTCARRLIVIRGSAGERAIERFIALAQQIRVGRYTDAPEPFMGPLIHSRAVDHLLAAQTALEQRGGTLLLEAKPLPSLGPAFVSPGIVDVTAVRDRTDEEIFGPLVQLIRVESFDAALVEANRTQYGLAAGLLSDDAAEYAHFYREVQAGVISWNAPTTGASSAMPFGGVGKSGNHRPSAFYAADYCAYPVACIENAQMQLPGKVSPGITL